MKKSVITLALFLIVLNSFAFDLLDIMEQELARNLAILGKPQGDMGDSAYFIRYEIFDEESYRASADYGTIMDSRYTRRRHLNVELRMGDYSLDNSHKIRESWEWTAPPQIQLPLEDELAIRHGLWYATDEAQRQAQQSLIKVRANLSVKVEEEDTSDDFSRETPSRYEGEVLKLVIDTVAIKKLIRDASAIFRKYPDILEHDIGFSEKVETKYIVNSEGTRIRQSQRYLRIFISVRTKAYDGMELFLYKDFDAWLPGELPDSAELAVETEKLCKDIMALRDAPLVEPYAGPAILEAEAAAVFFHEILGHRLERHRLKDVEEGQTFKKKLGEKVLPEFLSVKFDPSIEYFGKIPLFGFYRYDDEGVPSRSVSVVEKGILKGFLMSRIPIDGFPNSNGHGRCQAGSNVVTRQSNMFIIAEKAVSPDELRKLLIAECKKQGKPFGLLFKKVSGGFTITKTYFPQTFEVLPLLVYKIYVDGRPDEIVRGVNIVGTPLSSFENITAAGNDTGVFSGYCGAESGMVPVAAVSPSLLVSKVEVEKRHREQSRLPILKPPDMQIGEEDE